MGLESALEVRAIEASLCGGAGLRPLVDFCRVKELLAEAGLERSLLFMAKPGTSADAAHSRKPLIWQRSINHLMAPWAGDGQDAGVTGNSMESRWFSRG